MTGDPERDPDRSPPARPVRVARFDDLNGLDGLDGGGRPGTTVAGFDGLGAAPPVAAPVASLDALDTRTADRRTDRRAAARPGRRDETDRPAEIDRPESPGVEPERLDARRRPPAVAEREPAADDPSEDDGVPPDRPLPRGRRRGARAGRLGPDAPDPDRAEPEPAADPVVVAREICLRLLTDRARTRQELAQALARKGVPDDAAASVLDRFDEVGLIDDVAFAGQWVRSRHVHRGLGRRAIAVELRRKGVADDIAGEALAEVDAESEDRRARELVDRKLRSLTLDTAEQRASVARRLVGMLARKGYGAGTAYRVVRETLAERGAELDELAGGHDG